MNHCTSLCYINDLVDWITLCFPFCDCYSTTNPLYMDMDDQDDHIYDNIAKSLGDDVSQGDTITDSMMDYCDEKKLIMD